MKIIKIITLLLLLPTVFFSQDVIKKRIGFIPYTNPENADQEYRELAYRNIYDAALRVFINTQRFEVLDRGSFNVIKIEKEFQKGEDLANSEIVAQSRIAAAQLIAVAKITTLTVTESDDGEGYSVYLTAEFKQIDVESGEALNAFQLRSEIIDKQTNAFGGNNKRRITTEEEAISRAVIKIEKELEKWIKETFPMILKVLDVEPDMSVIVEGGRDIGLSENFKMKAIKLKVFPNGKKFTSSLGKLEFTRDGVGEELTKLKFDSKTDWDKFKKAWQGGQEGIYVTEDI